AKLVVFDGDIPIEEIKTSNETLEHLPEFIKKYRFSQGIIGTVFGITVEAERQLKKLKFPLLHLNAHTPIPIFNDYRTPETLGTDRLAAAVGAYTQHPNHDILIVDAGTCLTFEFINKEGHYKGGCISPGLQMRLKSLRAFTAKLPLIDSEGPLPEIGYDTETSIRTGVIRGMKFEIEGHIKYFQDKYPDLLVFLTGGDIFNFDSKMKNLIFADKYIVPRGLNRILVFNNEQS
ncbi:MAG: type III pantothenate kinase, partial [Paraprevotella sp.]|nr:type III pantothenate kinase [Paraprevotella sp.]